MVWGCLSASQAYASGQYRGQRTFLRFSDLKEFAEDATAQLPAKNARASEKWAPTYTNWWFQMFFIFPSTWRNHPI